MILSLKNIGKVESAVVEINGITVIAGENNTGKSTVGKTLYCIFNSFYNIEHQIQFERVESLEKVISSLYRYATNRFTLRIDVEEIAYTILENVGNYSDDLSLLQSDIVDAIVQGDPNFEKYVNSIDWKKYLEKIKNILEVSDEEIFASVLSKKLTSEFSGQINNLFLDNSGEITLQIKKEVVSITIDDNSVKSISDGFHLNTEALYVDDPFVIDDYNMPLMYRYGSVDHRNHLKSKLFNKDDPGSIIGEIIATSKLDNIYTKINSVCAGEIVRGKRSVLGYKRDNSEKVLDPKNISTGLKTFVILKTLLQNGSLVDNGTIILDEPEIHLHPEWQILFAELIVLIQKEFNMHILLTTHSPYFLNAIEVYAAKHEITDRCKYYMATSSGDISKIEDVSNNIEIIYQHLARPLQELENVRWRDDD